MKTDYEVILNREQVEGKELKFSAGNCAADIRDLNQPRNLSWVLENITDSLIKAGYLGDGVSSKFDDRKIRFDGVIINKDSIEIEVGVTSFQAYQTDLNKRTPEQNMQLKNLGMILLKDRYAFFARPMGVTVLPITAEGSIFLGDRLNVEYTGQLHGGAAGYINYRSPESIDTRIDLFKELEEELGIKEESLGAFEVVGISYHTNTGETDISYLVKTDVEDDYFESGKWKERVDEREHREFIKLANTADIRLLLDTGNVRTSDKTYEILYSTRQALESVREEDLN